MNVAALRPIAGPDLAAAPDLRARKPVTRIDRLRRGGPFSLALHALALVGLLIVIRWPHTPEAETGAEIPLIIDQTPSVGAGSRPQTIQQTLPNPPPPAPPIPQGPDASLPKPPPPAPRRKLPTQTSLPVHPQIQRRAPVEAHNGPGQDAARGTGIVTGASIVPASPDDPMNQTPAYPERAKIRGEQGRVELSIYIMPDGRPDRVLIAQSSGYRILDDAAQSAVMMWHFKPALQNGKPVASVLPFYVRFDLH